MAEQLRSLHVFKRATIMSIKLKFVIFNPLLQYTLVILHSCVYLPRKQAVSIMTTFKYYF